MRRALSPPETVERAMALLALGSAGVMTLVAGATGWLAGPHAAATALLGVGVAVALFVVQVVALSWAGGVSHVAVQVIALSGFLLRLGIVVWLFFWLATTPWFSPLAFALSVVPATVALLQFESVLVHRGIGSELGRKGRRDAPSGRVPAGR